MIHCSTFVYFVPFVVNDPFVTNHPQKSNLGLNKKLAQDASFLCQVLASGSVQVGHNPLLQGLGTHIQYRDDFIETGLASHNLNARLGHSQNL